MKCNHLFMRLKIMKLVVEKAIVKGVGTEGGKMGHMRKMWRLRRLVEVGKARIRAEM